jgi:hypothetical protein
MQTLHLNCGVCNLNEPPPYGEELLVGLVIIRGIETNYNALLSVSDCMCNSLFERAGCLAQ